MNIEVLVKCFGAFRACGESVAVQVPEGSSAAQVKQALAEKLEGRYAALVTDSVLASDSAVLQEDELIESGSGLSLLPPVCGG